MKHVQNIKNAIIFHGQIGKIRNKKWKTNDPKSAQSVYPSLETQGNDFTSFGQLGFLSDTDNEWMWAFKCRELDGWDIKQRKGLRREQSKKAGGKLK